MAQPQKILVPTDFSEHSEGALRYACELARQLGASLTILHVYQVPGFTLPEGVILGGPQELSSVLESVDRDLQRVRTLAFDLGVEAESQSVCGGPSEEICRFAQEQGFDLIVMATHGRTGVRHLLLGSIAEQVLRGAPCPVLTTRPVAKAA
jgi:universal stress protein A